MDNPIPILDEEMKKINADSYWVHLGLSIRTLITKDESIVQHVLQKNHRNYHKSKIQSELLAKYIGQGLLTSNGDYWLKQRRLIQPGFHKKHLESFIQIMQEEIRSFVGEWSEKIKGQTININDEMSALTIRVVSRALFSSDIKPDEIKFIANTVDDLQGAVVKDIRQPFLSWWRKLNGEESKYGQSAKRLYDLIQSKIDHRRKLNAEAGDLLDMLLGVRYEDSNSGMSNQQLIDEILILYAAGYETTANALSWTFYLLDKHPEYKRQLIEEIQSIELSDTVQIDDLRQFVFTRQIISESMRLYPPAWIMDRVAIADDNINGIPIKKGDVISLYLYGLHHDEKHWPDAEVFNPKRFEPNKNKERKSFNYVPFGNGPRMCIGHQFANMELMLSLYYIIKSYDLTLAKDQKVELNPLITLRPKEGIKMHLQHRDLT